MTGRYIGGKLTGKNSVSYGTGQYDKSGHGGTGTKQKMLSPAAGEEKGATKHAPSAIARDGVEGKGSPGRGYQTDAHSGSHHGKSGEAVGHKNDFHMDYGETLYGEGRGYAPEGKNPGHIMESTNSKATKAAHHPEVTGPTHKFPQMKGGDGFGYGSGQRNGHLRMSGHSRAHQVGKR